MRRFEIFGIGAWNRRCARSGAENHPACAHDVLGAGQIGRRDGGARQIPAGGADIVHGRLVRQEDLAELEGKGQRDQEQGKGHDKLDRHSAVAVPGEAR